MVRSENFGDIIAMMVATDKLGIVSFLRGQGVSVSPSDDVTEVVKVLYMALTSDKLKDNFIKWAESRYQNTSNFSGSYKGADGNFDPMATQGSGQEFDPLSSQMGTNLLEDNFANASGEFNPMSTQSGGFSPMETQFANMSSGLPNTTTGTGMPNLTTGSTIGNDVLNNKTNKGSFWSGLNLGDTISSGIEIWKISEKGKQDQKLIDAQIKAKELELQALVEQGKLSTQQMEQQLALLKAQKNAPQSSVILYVIGGVVLLGALGTAIYFATRKK